jgi:hypothetical protein
MVDFQLPHVITGGLPQEIGAIWLVFHTEINVLDDLKKDGDHLTKKREK